MKQVPLPKVQGKPMAPILDALMKVKPEKVPQKQKSQASKQRP